MFSPSPPRFRFKPEREPFFEVQDLFEEVRIPNVVVTTDGTVLALADKGRLVRRSTDGGASFSPAQEVGHDAGGSAIVDSGNGDVLVVDSGRGHLWRSRDQGHTWTREEIVVKPNPMGHGGLGNNSVGADGWSGHLHWFTSRIGSMHFVEGSASRSSPLTFAENMIRYLSIVGFSIALVACDSQVTRTESHHSLGGKRQITVAQELQGANDPSPWWTHVSLTTAGDDSPRIPGNLLKLEGRGMIAADWNSSSEVTVSIDDSLFSQVPSSSLVLHDTRITYRRASSRTATNSEQGAP